MAFDIYQNVFNRNGSPSERKSQKYQNDLMRLFAPSPEGQTLTNEGIDGGRTFTFLDFGINYLGMTPPQMSADSLRTILFQLFPQKFTTTLEDSPNMIRELQQFWQFLKREFNLKNADACLKVLNDKATVKRYEKEMRNSANYGIAKSFAMMGLERGFDLSTQEGVDEWMQIYNEELASGKGQRIKPFGLDAQGLLNRLLGGTNVVDSTVEEPEENKAVNTGEGETQHNLLQRKAGRRTRHKKHGKKSKQSKRR